MVPWLAGLPSVATALLMIAACAGWGRLAARWARADIDGGLMTAWGLAVLLALGGVATALGVAVAPVLVAIELGGVAALLLPPRPHLPRLDRGQMLTVALAVLVLGLRMALVSRLGALEPCDDFLAYQPLVQQVLEAGHLEAPFSLRRLAAYGGQTLLQAYAVPSGDPAAMLMADGGVGPVLLFGLAWSFLRRYGRPPPLALVLALVVGLGMILRVNTASQATSLVCFLALARTLCLVVEGERRLRLCIVLGLLAAAASSLRHLNLPFPALLMLAFLPAHAGRVGWRAALADAAAAGGAWCVFLAPWMAALYASSATPLYPLIRGYHTGVDFAAVTGGWRQVAAGIGGAFQVPQFAVMVLMAPVAFFIAQDRRVRLIQIAAIAGAAVIVAGFPAAEARAMARYCLPTLATAFFITMLAALATGVISRPVVRVGIALVLAFGLGRTAYLEGRRLLTAPVGPAPLVTERLKAYAEAQRLVPAGEPIFVYVSTPFGFDTARNRILNADEPGAVSPPPGLPFFLGSEAVAVYLRGQGVRYVGYEDFDTAVTWCIRPSAMGDLSEPLWQSWKPYLFDFMASLRELGRSRKVVYDAHGVTLIDLDQPAASLDGALPRHSP